MFKSIPKCPVDPDTRVWVEKRMAWLASEFGRDRLRSAPVVLPTSEFFPDPYDGSDEAVRAILDRVCGYMGVPPESIEFSIYDDKPPIETDGLVRGTVGLYQEEGDNFRIWLESGSLDDPLALVATMAHELGHVLLLGSGRVSADEPDHEPLTDLLTVFLGLGVITSNSVVREKNWRMGHFSAWGVSRQGYLTMPVYGYALAVFSVWRDEDKPRWARSLRPDVRQAFDQGRRFLALEDNPAAPPGPTKPFPSKTGDPPGQAEPGQVAEDPDGEDDGISRCPFCEAVLDESEREQNICDECQYSAERNRQELIADQLKEEADYRAKSKVARIAFACIVLFVLVFILIKAV